ncbi:unnamed protein product [Ectocarpus sp. CCAP 1310/34]|nr:unnamed protein product [Ectocarpus sp. CCAP 1310/34]
MCAVSLKALERMLTDIACKTNIVFNANDQVQHSISCACIT